MSGKRIEFTKTQKYRFDFGADGQLYIAIFNGKMPQAELRGLVSSLHNCLYEKMPETILLYLKQHHLEYSNFHCIEIPLEQDEAMDWGSYLLHSETYDKMDETLADVNVFYAAMDFQKDTSEGHCKGCYYALQRLSLGNGEYQHNLIGQAFRSEGHGCKEYGYFAIKKTKGNILYTIDSLEGEPALPAFGCVDIMALLMDIGSINSKEDAIRIALK